MSDLPRERLLDRRRDLMEVLGGSRMMPTTDFSGVAESSYGTTLGGFHCRRIEFQGRLEDLLKKMGRFDHVAQVEQEDFITFLAAKSDYALDSDLKPAFYRRETHKFFLELGKFLSGLKAAHIQELALSGSLGSVSLTVLYASD